MQINKRGISEVIAVILIILIVVFAITILWSVILPLVKEDIKFSDARLSIILEEGYTAYYPELNLASVQIRGDKEDSNLEEIQITFFVNGESHEFRVPYPAVNSALPGKNEVRTYWFNFTKEGIAGVPDYVSIAPIYSNGKVGDIMSRVKLPAKRTLLTEEEMTGLEFVPTYSRQGGGGGDGSGGEKPGILSGCGDMICNTSIENCSTCSADCGGCLDSGENIVMGTSGNDLFQIYNEKAWLNGIEINSSDNAVLIGNGGNDLFVTVGDGSQKIIGNLEGVDSYWIDSSDLITNLNENEIKYNLHNISNYEQPWTNDSGNENYVHLNSRGEKIKDPNAREDLFENYTYFLQYPLFRGEPDYTDIAQGNLGDCWLMAGLAEIAYREPEVIKQAIVGIGDGNYIVRLFKLKPLPTEEGVVFSYDTSGEVYYKVDGDLPIKTNGDLIYAKLGNRNKEAGINMGTDGSLWVALIEKAYVYFRTSLNDYRYLSGGSSSFTFPAIANRTMLDIVYTAPLDYSDIDWNNISLRNVSSFNNSETAFESGLNQIINIDNSVITATTLGSADNTAFVNNHVYAMLNNPIEDSNFNLKVYNPWGRDGKTWDTDSDDGILEVNTTVSMQGLGYFIYY